MHLLSTAGHVTRDDRCNLPGMRAAQVHIAMRHVEIDAARGQQFARALGEFDDEDRGTKIANWFEISNRGEHTEIE